jgi:hypothetical protein
MDLDIVYDTTGDGITDDRALYEIHTETNENEPKDYIYMVRGSNVADPYRISLGSVYVKGCHWWGTYSSGSLHEQFRAPGNSQSSTYCGGEYGGDPGDENFIAKILVEAMANQATTEVKFHQTDLSGTPSLDGGPLFFGNDYLAQAQAVAKLEGIARNNNFGFFFLNTARGAYVRFYPQKPERIILRGFVWYANPEDVTGVGGFPPPGFFKNSYVFFRGERILISSHGWSQNYDGSDASKRVHGMHYNFWMDNDLNITREHKKNGVWYVKSKWQMKAEIIPGPYAFPY